MLIFDKLEHLLSSPDIKKFIKGFFISFDSYSVSMEHCIKLIDESGVEVKNIYVTGHHGFVSVDFHLLTTSDVAKDLTNKYLRLKIKNRSIMFVNAVFTDVHF